jgi:hypothetical protein
VVGQHHCRRRRLGSAKQRGFSKCGLERTDGPVESTSRAAMRAAAVASSGSGCGWRRR